MISGPVGGHLQRVQPDGTVADKLHPAAAAKMLFDGHATRTAVAGHVLFAAFATPQLYSALFIWQLVFECVARPQIFLCHTTRGVILGPQLTSFVCVLVGVLRWCASG